MKLKKIILVFIFFVVFNVFQIMINASLLQAAPIPMTGDSILNLTKWNSSLSQMKIKFKLISDEWIMLPTPQVQNQLQSKTQFSVSNQNRLQFDFGLKTLSSTARLSLKAETIQLKGPLQNHIKKYLRDYNLYGFEIISTQKMKLKQNDFTVIDVIQKNKLTQARQYFIYNQDQIITFTCIDKTHLFKMTGQLCHQLVSELETLPRSLNN